MSVKLFCDRLAIVHKVKGAWKDGLPMLSEEILADCNEYCKEYTTTLIKSSLIHSRPQKGKLIWRTPYARRQYWKIETAHKDKNPNATWKWCEVAKEQWLERWNNLAQKHFDENL